MQNPYIVRLYGAIRHGDKIYIFSEFIDGKQKFLLLVTYLRSLTDYIYNLKYSFTKIQKKITG